eukprot:scaffold4654_cov155-Skeletonema_marinoi.AAC.2
MQFEIWAWKIALLGRMHASWSVSRPYKHSNAATNTIMQSILAIRNTHHHLDTSSSEEERKEQLATHQYSMHLLSV